MAHPIYGYAGVASGGGSIYSAPPVTTAGDSGSFTYDFERIAARYATSFGFPATDTTGIGVSGLSDPLLTGVKRSVEALYYQSVLGGHSTVGEGIYANTMIKRPRIEGNLPVYPQRPGQKDCTFYMMTRTCKFGDSCKFDHPIWVPEGGIPDWKEIPMSTADESAPERPGEPDCPYYMKTNICKFGARCKFNHPKEKTKIGSETSHEGTETANISVLPERPSEPICSFYAKTGKCKFGASCKFHHPKDVKLPANETQGDNVANTGTNGEPAFAPALMHNSKGLPIRPGETDCPFYMKTGSCKYGAVCRYNHPDQFAINSLVLPLDTASLGIQNSMSRFSSNINLQQPAQLGPLSFVYPQRPGATLCDFYMKTGQCKFADRCKFHHPIDRANPDAVAASSQLPVKLTLAGLPRREGAKICSFYMKNATCKFGATCKFDHPPPGEAATMVQEAGLSIVESDKADGQ